MPVDDPFLRVFCDDSDSNFNFTSPGWSSESNILWAGGSRSVFDAGATGESKQGEFSFAFNGASPRQAELMSQLY